MGPLVQAPDVGAATGRQARCQRQAMSEDDMHDGSASYQVLRARLDGLEIEFQALEALPPRTYGRASPTSGDGSYRCAGCGPPRGSTGRAWSAGPSPSAIPPHLVCPSRMSAVPGGSA